MEYINQISNLVTLEFTLLALSIGMALTFLMSLSAMRSRRTQPSKPLIDTGDHTEIFTSLQNQITELKQTVEENKALNKQTADKITKTSLVRFNPFRDSGVGGNQSFSLAQVDTYGNGSLITHLFSREMSRVSAKKIENWKSEQELSPEEKQALEELK